MQVDSVNGLVLATVEPHGFVQAYRVIWPSSDELQSGRILITRSTSSSSNLISQADVPCRHVPEFSVKRRNTFSGGIGKITDFSIGGTTPLVVLSVAALRAPTRQAHHPTTGSDRSAIPPRHQSQSHNPGARRGGRQSASHSATKREDAATPQAGKTSSCPVRSPNESSPLRKFWTTWRLVGSDRADSTPSGVPIWLAMALRRF